MGLNGNGHTGKDDGQKPKASTLCICTSVASICRVRVAENYLSCLMSGAFPTHCLLACFVGLVMENLKVGVEWSVHRLRGGEDPIGHTTLSSVRTCMDFNPKSCLELGQFSKAQVMS